MEGAKIVRFEDQARSSAMVDFQDENQLSISSV